MSAVLAVSPPARLRLASLPVVLAVILATAFFTAASYPGFMSFDSIEALRQARFQVEGSQYPPFGSYVWRIFDAIWPGPTLMQLVQNGLLLGSFAWVLVLLRWHPIAQVAAVVTVAALPPIAGTMLVVWKDVAVAAFFLAGFATLFFVQQRVPRQRAAFLVLAVALVFCGMAYRFNAASGAAPLLVYAAWLALDGDAVPGRRLQALVSGTFLLFSLFAVVWVVNSFRFPTMERLERNTNMDSIMRFDLAGITRYSGISVLPARDGGMVPVEYVRRIYDPRHLNITSANDTEGRLARQEPGEIARSWVAAVRAHPLAYLRHRLEVFRIYVGLHRGEVFYVTHPSVDQNTLGVTHEPTALTRLAVGYIWERRNGVLNHPWVYYVAGLVALALLFLTGRTRHRAAAFCALASGLLYLAPMFLITPAGDLRYNFWSIWGALLCLVFVASAWLPRAPDERRG